MRSSHDAFKGLCWERRRVTAAVVLGEIQRTGFGPFSGDDMIPIDCPGRRGYRRNAGRWPYISRQRGEKEGGLGSWYQHKPGGRNTGYMPSAVAAGRQEAPQT